MQQEWINDGNFVGLDGERDPIIGRQDQAATFTIPKDNQNSITWAPIDLATK